MHDKGQDTLQVVFTLTFSPLGRGRGSNTVCATTGNGMRSIQGRICLAIMAKRAIVEGEEVRRDDYLCQLYIL